MVFRVPRCVTVDKMAAYLPAGHLSVHRQSKALGQYRAQVWGGRPKGGHIWYVGVPAPLPKQPRRPGCCDPSHVIHAILSPYLGHPTAQQFDVTVHGWEGQQSQQVAAHVSKKTGLPTTAMLVELGRKDRCYKRATVTVPCCIIDATIEDTDAHFTVRMCTSRTLHWHDCAALMRLDVEDCAARAGLEGVGPLLRVEFPPGHIGRQELQYPTPTVLERPRAVYAHV